MHISLSIISLDKNREVINGFEITISDAPALQGSAKQVAWAERIREEAIRDFLKSSVIARTKIGDHWLKNMSFRDVEVDEAIAQINHGCAQLAAILAGKTSAAAWIDASGGKGSFLTINTMIKG